MKAASAPVTKMVHPGFPSVTSKETGLCERRSKSAPLGGVAQTDKKCTAPLCSGVGQIHVSLTSCHGHRRYFDSQIRGR